MISIQDLKASYGKGGNGFSLELSNLDVKPGEILVMVGPNGSGKSSLFRAVLGEMPNQEGEILLDSKPIEQLPPRERASKLAYVPATQPLGFPMSLREYLTLGLYPSLGDQVSLGPEDRERMEQALAKWDLQALADHTVDSLSAGERQRASLARAQVQGAGIWLLDEPGAHLDVAHQGYMARNLRQAAREQGVCILLVLHDLNWVAPLADRVALFQEGRIKALGPWPEVGRLENLQNVFGPHLRSIQPPGEAFPLFLPETSQLSAGSESTTASKEHTHEEG